MAALMDKNMLNNSIVLFLSDNGGATHGFNGNVASNWPLRGCKETLWEGGVRAAGVVWSPLLRGAPRVHRGLVNVQDWLPTLMEAAGAPTDFSESQGVAGTSQWAALQQTAEPPYTIMLHTIDPVEKIGALRHGDWKLVTGRTYNGAYDGFYGRLSGRVPYDLGKIRESQAGKAVSASPSPLPKDTWMLQMRADATVSCTPAKKASPHVIQVRQATFTIEAVQSEPPRDDSDDSSTKKKKIDKGSNSTECLPHVAPCLFNLRDDPCEIRNLAAEFPDRVVLLRALLDGYLVVPPNNAVADPSSYPEHWNNTWIPWKDYE